MPLPPAQLAAPVAVALAGLAALALRPASGLHRALAALLLLRAGLMLANAAVAGADDLASARAAAATATWYTLAREPLVVALALAMLPRWRPALLLPAVALALAGAVAFSLKPTLFVAEVAPLGAGFGVTSGPLAYVAAALAAGGDALVVVLCARAPERRGAAGATFLGLLGLAFALLPLHGAAFFVSFSLGDPARLADGFHLLRASATVLSGIVILAHLPRLLGRARLGRVALVALSLSILLGLFDGAYSVDPARFPSLAGYARSIVAVRIVFAALVLFAIVRYGVADAGRAERARIRLGIRATLLAGLAGALLAVAVAALGPNALGVGLGLALAAGAPFAARGPADRAAAALARRLLLPPDDPRAVAARASAYAGALEASRGAGAEGERLLLELRDDLGLSEREHELLASGLASREAPRYTTVRALGSGTTARAELARDTHGREVVVKRFRAGADAARVLREARAMMGVQHPRVLPLLAADREGDEIVLVTPYAPGGSARDLLERDGPLPPERALALAHDLLAALDALHAAGIVHCDVKAENLLLDADGSGMLADLGSAHVLDADATMGGEGTLATISPEALRGAAAAPARDLYAAGATLYRLLTGEHHVDLAGASAFVAKERILLDAPRLPHPRVPASFEAVLRRALAKRPEERYASAREMREALMAPHLHHGGAETRRR